MNLNNSLLSGIQQVGIGCVDAEASFTWYRKVFGMDVPVFKDASTAALMTRYTGGEARKRYAILALNMQGGGGFEIWQYTERKPAAPEHQVVPGDLGIFGVLMKTHHVEACRSAMLGKGLEVSDIFPDPAGGNRFFMHDPHGNRFTFSEGMSWFSSGAHPNGGVQGVQIGVSDMERSIEFYRNVLGYNRIQSDHTSRVAEYGGAEYRRVLLRTEHPRRGAFSRLLGDTEIELVYRIDNTAKQIFKNRYWGDLGFIHVCFDVNDMQALKASCMQHNAAFTVDSAESFDMGAAAGHFAYIEDPDGTLIEFVQTHKLPIMKKLNWYLDLRKRASMKPLPDWMLGAMRFSRVKG